MVKQPVFQLIFSHIPSTNWIKPMDPQALSQKSSAAKSLMQVKCPPSMHTHTIKKYYLYIYIDIYSI